MTSRNFEEKRTLSRYVTFCHTFLNPIKYDVTNVFSPRPRQHVALHSEHYEVFLRLLVLSHRRLRRVADVNLAVHCAFTQM